MKFARIAVLMGALACTLAPQLEANSIVVPNGLETTSGNINNLIPFSAGRFGIGSSVQYQQVYAASQFGSPGSETDIGSIAFRLASGDAPGPFSDTYSSFQVELSETPAAPNALSTTFASNLGADNTVVYSGPLTVTGGGGQNPNPFDLVINLQKPFLYNSSMGNLLLDIQVNGPNGPNGLGIVPTLDAVEGSPFTSRVYTDQGSNSTTGIAGDFGLVTEFLPPQAHTATPEPGSLVLFGTGLLGIALFLRKRLGFENRVG